MLSPDSLQTNIAAFLAPWPRLCVSQHGAFCLTLGGNTPITGPALCGHHPHPGLRHQAMQYADPCHPRPSRVCPRCLHTVNIIINMARCQEHQRLCHKHQDIMCVGHWDKVSPWGDKDNGCLVPGMWAEPNGRLGSELTLVAIRAIERRGRDTQWEQECDRDWQLNKYSSQQ